MDKRNWKILYTNYEGLEKKAVDLINEELGGYILRDKGRYTIHVLACEKENGTLPDSNSVIIGVYKNSTILKKYINENEIPEDGYVVKVMDNPENSELKLVLITAKAPREVFYGAVEFADDFPVKVAPESGSLRFIDEAFDQKLPDYYSASAPKTKKRAVFTWGNPINDYKDYIQNIARMRLNQLIMWNDFLPINAKEVVEYAHEYGIEVIWGFAWGWSRKCDTIDIGALDALTQSVIDKYEKEYADTNADGIYFQSFTELTQDRINGKLIAEVVVDFVNKTASKLLEKHPGLYIQFGLHATSVKDHMEYIAKVDPRVEIMWEDCGATCPFSNSLEPGTNEEIQRVEKFTDEMISLRENGGVSMLYKGLSLLDWRGDNFVHQCGPFVLGRAGKKIVEHDREVMKPLWRSIQAQWYKNGIYVYNLTKHIYENNRKDITIGMAGQFAGGHWFPVAFCSQMLWSCDEPYEEIMEKVTKRRVVDLV